MRNFTAFLLSFFILMPAFSESCKPIRHVDGDTFTYFDQAAGSERKVRVKGFDAPEKSQPFSRQATTKLRELTEGGADCDCQKLDKYGRSVCTVRTLDGRNVATEMLREGFGCIDPRFEKEISNEDRESGRKALKEAQANKRGMWVQDEVKCGFDYRKENRK